MKLPLVQYFCTNYFKSLEMGLPHNRVDKSHGYQVKPQCAKVDTIVAAVSEDITPTNRLYRH